MNKKSKLHKREWQQNQEDDDEDDIQQPKKKHQNKEDDNDEKDEEEESGQKGGLEDEDDDDDEDDEDDYDDDDVIDLTKRKVDVEEEDDDEEDDDDDDEEEGEEGSDSEDVLNVDILFKDASEAMFHSVKGLVNGYLDGSSYNSSDLSDLIVKQYLLGSFMVIDEEEDEDKKKIREKCKLEKEINSIGFCTILNLQRKEKVILEIIKFIQESSLKYSQEDSHQKLLSIMKNKKVGLLINERIINVSPKVVPELHTQILEDHKWVQQNHQKDFQDLFDFDYVVCISKCSKENIQKKDQQQGHKKVKKEELEEYLYSKYEDFCLLEHAEIKFFFEAQHDQSQSGLSKQSMDQIKRKEIPYKMIYLVKMSDYFKTIPEMALQLEDEDEEEEEEEGEDDQE